MHHRTRSHRSILSDRVELDDVTPSTTSMLTHHNMSVVSRATVNLSSLNRQLSMRSNREAGFRLVIEQSIHHNMAINKILRTLTENFFPEYKDLIPQGDDGSSDGTDIKLITRLQTTTMGMLKVLLVALMNHHDQQEELAAALAQFSDEDSKSGDDGATDAYTDLETSISHLTALLSQLKRREVGSTVDIKTSLSSGNPLYAPNVHSDHEEDDLV